MQEYNASSGRIVLLQGRIMQLSIPLAAAQIGPVIKEGLETGLSDCRHHQTSERICAFAKSRRL